MTNEEARSMYSKVLIAQQENAEYFNNVRPPMTTQLERILDATQQTELTDAECRRIAADIARAALGGKTNASTL